MATPNGTSVNFGFTGTNGIVITGLSGTLLQSASQRKKADLEEVRGGTGDAVNHTHYNIHDEAELEWVITGTGTSIASAVTATSLSALTPGTIIAISTCASMPDLVASTWEVQDGGEISGSNTTSKRCRVPIRKYANITGASGA